MSDEGTEWEVIPEPSPIPSYGDNIAQRAQAFQYLAAQIETVTDAETKRLGYAMLKALVEKVTDKPLRGLKTVESENG